MADQTSFGGQRDFASDTSSFNAIEFVVRMMLGATATAAVVQVRSVSPSAIGPNTGVVSVQPMVNQIDGQGLSTPHGEIFNIPYFRLQGGTNAVIIDPVVGDIGVAVFASRDISAVKSTRAVSNPGSRRRFDMADGLYIGGFLNGTPTQYIAFTESGITAKTSTFTIEGKLVVTETIEGAGITDTVGDVTLGTHTTTGVTPGGGTSGPPTPGS